MKKQVLKSKHLAGTLLMVTLAPFMTLSAAQAGDSACLDGAKPLLSVADFSGDGVVDNSDLVLIGRVLKNGRYIAFYDRNADGQLNARDLDLANRDLGMNSSTMDQEIAAVYWGTTRYRSLGQAVLDGYEPTTQVVAGHGRHWMQAKLMREAAYPGSPRLDQPAGLNYDEDGNLQAVFWAQPTAFPVGSLPPPRLFTDPQMWHGHNHSCVVNYGLINTVQFRENVLPAHCEQAGGKSGTFYMLHLWLYRLNPNGAFSMTHPCA